MPELQTDERCDAGEPERKSEQPHPVEHLGRAD